MQSGTIHTYGRTQLFASIGGIALKSSRDYIVDMADLSGWLSRSRLNGATGPETLPESYFKTLLEPYVSDHTSIEFGHVYPTFSDLSI